MRLYSLSKDCLKIPMYCYHECNEYCSMIITQHGNIINFQDNKEYDIQTETCVKSNKLCRAFIDIASYDISKPHGNYGPLFAPDIVIIPDLSFTICIVFPLTLPVKADVVFTTSVTLRSLLGVISDMYKYIYFEEERTSDPTSFVIERRCPCIDMDLKDIIKTENTYTENTNIKESNIEDEDDEDNIEDTNVEDMNDKEECSICYTTLQKTHVRLDCQHRFHHECMYNWIEKGNGTSCPLCRKSLYQCKHCDNTYVVKTTEEHVVLPVNLRMHPERNDTNGTFGIYRYDLETLVLTNMFYNMSKKTLQLEVKSMF